MAGDEGSGRQPPVAVEPALDELRRSLHQAADMVADYLDTIEQRSVLSPTRPGEVAAALPSEPPAEGEPMERLLRDWREGIVPHLTHWNHPEFFAYFAISGSAPGIVAELLAAATNVNAMLWRTSPAATELEGVACDWLRQMLGLPAGFEGHINDTASSSSLIALAAARARSEPSVRQRGVDRRLVVYASDQAHSSIGKAVITLGLGLDQLRHIESDEEFRMRPEALRAAIAEDRRGGAVPCAVVATAGTTSTTSVDPLLEVAEVCAEHDLWLHVDAAYAGAAAICPQMRPLFDGIERADSVVVNPHKWLFVPLDCSVLFLRSPDAVREAFALVPEYLRTGESGVRNLMDLGPQLGRRFRALKLWFVIRRFGVEGLRRHILRHCELARQLAAALTADERFEIVAPVRFSTVCFRLRLDAARDATEAEIRSWNEALLARLDRGPYLLSATEAQGRYFLRAAIGNLQTESRHVDGLRDLLLALAAEAPDWS